MPVSTGSIPGREALVRVANTRLFCLFVGAEGFIIGLLGVSSGRVPRSPFLLSSEQKLIQTTGTLGFEQSRKA